MEGGFSQPTLQDLQERVLRDIPERFHYPRILSVLALSEEVGELLSEISRVDGHAAVASEVGDVLLCCIEIANCYGFTLQSPEPAAPANPISAAVGLCIAAAKVSKECLETEGFGQPRHEQLRDALNRVVQELGAMAASLNIDLASAFEKKFGKILGRIADGTWDRLYGNLLVERRMKYD